MSKRSEKVALLLPSILLIMVACIQMAFAHFQGWDPWKGGGFGMFSTLDGRTERQISCLVRDETGTEHLVSLDDSYRKPRTRLERVFRKQLRKLYSLPSEQGLNELAEMILDSSIVSKERFDLQDVRWLEKESRGAELTLPKWIQKSTKIYRLADRRDRNDEEIEKIKPVSVELHLWRLKFDVKRNRFYWKLMRQADADLGS